MISLEQFIQTVKGQNNFWKQTAFLTCSWRYLRSNKLERLEFKLGFRNVQEKLEKIRLFVLHKCGHTDVAAAAIDTFLRRK